VIGRQEFLEDWQHPLFEPEAISQPLMPEKEEAQAAFEEIRNLVTSLALPAFCA
jgi:hypothetical protein